VRALRDHYGDYGVDGAFHTVPARVQAAGVAAGCAVLLAAAKLLPRGRAIGVDVWRADQTDSARRMWWGGPWLPTHLVTATKPTASDGVARSVF
jgi:hypothetical protein